MKEIIIMNIIAILVVSLLSLICRAIEIKTVEKKTARLHREVSEHKAAITMSGGWKPKPENIIVREVRELFILIVIYTRCMNFVYAAMTMSAIVLSGHIRHALRPKPPACSSFMTTASRRVKILSCKLSML